MNDNPHGLRGRQLYDADGRIIGVVHDVIDRSGDLCPRWYVVECEILGPLRLVPAGRVEDVHGRLTAPLDVAAVRSCPVEVTGTSVPASTFARVAAHYGVGVPPAAPEPMA